MITFPGGGRQRLSDPAEILPRARVDLEHFACLDKERHLHDKSCLHHRGLGAALCRIAAHAGIGLLDGQLHRQRRFDQQRLALMQQNRAGVALLDIEGNIPQRILRQRDLLIGLHVHEREELPVLVKVLIVAAFQPHLFHLFAGPKGLIHHAARGDVLQLGPDEGPPFARLHMLEFHNGP
jgi:hypothetical protein